MKIKTDKNSKQKPRNTWRSFIAGDILTDDFFKKHAGLFFLIFIMIVIYISNRYTCQHKQLEIEKLREELVDIKYEALTKSSELMEKSRQSKIEEYISRGSSKLETATTPPYLIK
ncbi:MAG: FtsL-like putative cell division protein [Bacteroides sp.]|nr:FtsL-like putative cell division protein [Bacteroides sp.]MDD2644780.1 FtsL-like putative cell division protein [Bacteroides sp.]MDD4054523.1 FtsL-like putative cell division protein [Bacteroides sp.]MDD4719432.1 FtsL-like putative cell division protein [Bacteroides sp.]NLI64664.1 hypothetical protein [Bacteroidales bacterium]